MHAEIADEDIPDFEDPDEVKTFRNLLLDASRLLARKLERDAASLAFDAFILLTLHGLYEKSGDKPESVFLGATSVFDEPPWKRAARRKHLREAWETWHSQVCAPVGRDQQHPVLEAELPRAALQHGLGALGSQLPDQLRKLLADRPLNSLTIVSSAALITHATLT
jgi:hypothetical protein